jgi:hypothetical protein
LFTLVGIAGEDDVDAPDLNEPTPADKLKITSKSDGNGSRQTIFESLRRPQQTKEIGYCLTPARTFDCPIGELTN